MEAEITNPYEIMARELMKIMLYDNGAVNRIEPETESRYKKSHLNAITNGCAEFFTVHPELVSDDHFENIAAGEEEENDRMYRIYPEFKNLDKALNKYFDIM